MSTLIIVLIILSIVLFISFITSIIFMKVIGSKIIKLINFYNDFYEASIEDMENCMKTIDTLQEYLENEGKIVCYGNDGYVEILMKDEVKKDDE